MAQKRITLDELRITMSGNFLCEDLPLNFNELSQKELDDFLTGNAWQPFEDDSASDIWDNIDNGAIALKMFLEKKGIKVTGD